MKCQISVILSSELKLLTEHTLTSCDFSETDILRIINNQDSNKAHGHDMISIRMLKLCGEAICRPLNIIFKTCLNTGKFPSEWKKGNVVPIYKKDDKQNVNNYCPVSLLPICGKMFERLIYNIMYDLIISFITSFLQTSQDLDRLTLPSINSFLLIMKF